MPQPLTALIPNGTAWYASVADFAKQGGIGAPGDRSRPMKLWRDNSMIVGAYWNPGASVYRALARDAAGVPLLTSIGSPEFYATYTSLSVVGTYKQFAFRFPNGVPYLVNMTVEQVDAEINLIGTSPAIDYPLAPGANHMLVFEGGQVLVYDYQEFSRLSSVPAAVPIPQRLAAIDSIRKSSMSPEAQFAAIRELCTISGNGNVQIS